nr:hypothetical protein 1.2 [Burkholderia phage Bups phi1]
MLPPVHVPPAPSSDVPRQFRASSTRPYRCLGLLRQRGVERRSPPRCCHGGLPRPLGIRARRRVARDHQP